jgi:hypothetical protein
LLSRALPIILLLWIGTPSTGAALAEFDGVNRLRLQAGLPALQWQPQLAEAARLHAAYLDLHRQPGDGGSGISAHAQRPGDAGFVAETPGERALAAGYPHRDVLENISMGYKSAAAALDGLTSAIYHRLTFFDLEADSIGVAVGERSRVFVLGRRDLALLCTNPPESALARQPVDCRGQPMRRQAYEAMCAAIPAEARFVAPYPLACPNGRLLDATFMAAVCADPPPAARFGGSGNYYAACQDGRRLDAAWFEALCANPPDTADYPHSGAYVTLCDAQVEVHAAWFEARCAALDENERYTDSGRYREPCAEPHPLRVEALDALARRRQETAPAFVAWPPGGATGIAPAFFVEEPDPLPTIDVSGNPVSVQFNPAHVDRVTDLRLALTRIDVDPPRPLTDGLLMDHRNDPNGILSPLEFAWFPFARLDWGATYEVLLDAVIDGTAERYRWEFSTAGDDLPVLTLDGDSKSFRVEPGRPYLLYLPPTATHAMTARSTRTRHIRGNSVDITFVDPNTLRVVIEARWCSPIRIAFDDGREAALLSARCDAS